MFWSCLPFNAVYVVLPTLIFYTKYLHTCFLEQVQWINSRIRYNSWHLYVPIEFLSSHSWIVQFFLVNMVIFLFLLSLNVPKITRLKISFVWSRNIICLITSLCYSYFLVQIAYVIFSIYGYRRVNIEWKVWFLSCIEKLKPNLSCHVVLLFALALAIFEIV